LKVVTKQAAFDDHDSVNYWKREFLAYREGLLTNLSPGIIAPRCYGAQEPGADLTWLWLEDVGLVPARHTISDYARFAYHLGLFGAGYTGEGRVPGYPWLNRHMLHGWLDEWATLLDRFPVLMTHPAVGAFLPAQNAQRLLELWKHREHLTAALDRLARTFCHHDAFGGNLVRHASGKTIALDWEFAGPGALGEDLGPLIGGSVAMFAVDATDIEDLSRTCLDAYREGLFDGRWRGEFDSVNRAFDTSAAMRFGVVWGAWLADLLSAPAGAKDSLEAFYHRPLPEIIEHFRVAMPWFLDRGGDALNFLNSDSTGR